MAEAYATRHPQDIVALAIQEFSPRLAISFSGAEDVALIDMASKIGGKFRVFTLDTGRLHTETCQFIEKVREHYGINIEAFFPMPRNWRSTCGETAPGLAVSAVVSSILGQEM